MEVYFSPQDGVAKYVLARLNAAKRSIHFMAFSYTANSIADAMVAKAKAGLAVRGVFETQNAGGTGSAFNRLKQGGKITASSSANALRHNKSGSKHD